MSCGCECGSLHRPIVAPPISVQAVIPAANIVAGWDAANLSASPVALWPDASGNGFDLAQPTGANQPTWGAATGPNSQPAVLFDGVDDNVNVALNLPAPGTTPTFFWGIVRQVTWTNGDFWWDDLGGIALVQSGVTPAILQSNGAGVNSTAFVVNTYRRLEVSFTNTIADYIKVGSISTTGASAGNLDPTGPFVLGANGIGTANSNIQVCELWIFNAVPTAAQLLQLDAYAANRYGAAVLT